MRRVTNLDLIAAALTLTLCVALAIILQPFRSVGSTALFFVLLVGVGFVGSFLTRSLRSWLINRSDSVLPRQASSKGWLLFANGVVAVWLCAVGLIVFLILSKKGSTLVSAVVAFMLLAGLVLGYYLQRRFFTTKSLLPYGLSFLISLLGILILVALGVGR